MRRSSVIPALLLATVFALPSAAHAQVDSLPYVTSITTIPPHPCDSIPTRIVFTGVFPTQCGAVLGNDGYTVYLSDPLPPCATCLEGPKPWADTLEVGLLAAGQHLFRIGVGIVDICTGSEPPDTTKYTNRFGITVGTVCPPDSGPDPLRYVEHLQITSVRDPYSSIICEGDSILLRMGGTFPNGCYQVRGIELNPALPTTAVPIPGPLVVQVVFDNLCCSLMHCTPGPAPWDTFLVIPPRFPGAQTLTLVGYETCCREEPINTDPKGVRYLGFSVVSAESCGVSPLPVCLYPGWAHDWSGGRCDAFIGKTSGPAVVTGTVQTNVALAGIQGEVHSYDVSGQWPLFVAGIEPIGPAAGMHLTWEAIPGGAKFVLWSDHDAPIPPNFGGPPAQFLKVSWSLGVRDTRENGIMPDSLRWYVSWHNVFGSDINGRLVPLCPIQTGVVAELAVICSGDGFCDANNDLHSDVRDLVLMSQCLVAPAGRNCPWDPATTFDCDADHDFDFDDLYCCARHVLGVPPCPGCGDSIRVESGITMSFGTPVRGTGVIEVPVRIDGMAHLGAARLTLAMPRGLANGATLELNNPDWLKVTRVVDERLEIGLIGIDWNSVIPEGPRDVDAVLRIPIATGSEVSGSIALVEADLSGRDGVKLRVDLGSPVVRLGPGVDISLSAPRPNPFGTSTMFRLTLDAPADADLAIYDLSGRRISTLHKGALPIGSHPFTWDGRVEGGGRARAGVYFARASVGGKVTKQKLVMLKE